MRGTCRSSEGDGAQRKPLGLMVGLVLLLVAVVPAPVHAAPQNLSGQWVNSANPRSSYVLRMSRDLSVLHADWAGLPPHQTLQGHFQGTRDVGGDTYSGTFNVTEQGASGSPPVSVTGSGTFALRSSFFASFPKIDVTLNPDNGGQQSEFTLEIFAVLPQILVPDGVTQEVTDPGTKPCEGSVDVGDPTGSNGRLNVGGIVRSAAVKKRNLGSKSFKLKPGKSRRISVSLNKRGRALLKKRGSLRVPILIRMNKASGLPTLTRAGVVTFKK